MRGLLVRVFPARTAKGQPSWLIVVVYLLIGTAWILFDNFFAFSSEGIGPLTKTQVAVVMGLLFVALSGAMIRALQIAEDRRRLALEEESRREKNFADTMLETMPGIVYFYTEQGQFLRWNKKFESVSGYSAAEIGQMNPLDFFAKQDQALLQQRIAEVFQNEASFVEAPFLTKDGRAIPYFFTGRRIVVDGRSCLVGMGIDIRERKLAEEMQRKNSVMQAIIDAIPTPLSYMDLDTRCLGVNRALEEVFSVRREDVVGKSISELSFLSEMDKQVYQGGCDEVRRTQGAISKEVALRFADRKVHPALFYLAAYPGSAEYSGGLVATIVDITHLKETERTLREIDAYNKILFHESYTPIAVMDPETLQITDCNLAAAKIYGYGSRDEVLGKTPLDVSAPTQYDGTDSLTALQRQHRHNQEHGVGMFEWRHRRPDGAIWDAEMFLMPFTYRGKNMFQFTLEDITERKRIQAALADAQAALKRENARIQAIIDTFPNPIFYKGANTRFLGFNRAYEEVFSVKGEDLIGLRVLDLPYLPQEDRAAFQVEDEELIRTGGSLRREVNLVFADGKSHPTLYYVSGLRNSEGAPAGLVGTFVDITELKETQTALAGAKENAEAATRAKGEFLASMSHEIRTPLNGIAGMADLLAQTELNGDQKHMLHTIRESGNALMKVINDILDFSKIEAGKLSIDRVSMSVADAVEGVAATLAPAACSKGVRIHTFVDPNIPATIQGDPVRLRQILFNLTGNAVKFSDKRDVVARAVVIDRPSSGGCTVRFELIDQGIGISEENQGKLFQAFSQAETSTTRRFGGTGLGLAICKRLVDLMGGVIGVSSRVGEGSTFFLELPFTAVNKARSQETPRDLDGIHILLVGGPDQREQAIKTYLNHWGAGYVFAYDERAALDALEKGSKSEAPFNAVIVDLDLESERQIRFVEQSRSVQEGAGVPCIVLQDFQNRSARIQGDNLVTVDANPLVRHRIISAVAVAAGRASPDVKRDDENVVINAVAAPTVEEAHARGQLILLAEDNPTNQDVIRRQLNLLGYTCEIAGNGVEALTAWRSGRYALILTDCHMPEMDGYELTSAIRKDEVNDRRIPIIAITANALQGEAERCFASGMDDYLSKPVTLPALREMLRKWIPVTGALSMAARAEAVSPPWPAVVRATGASDNPAIDARVIKEMFGEDDEAFKEILTSFVETSVELVDHIVRGCDTGNAEEIESAAHSLKSAARVVGAGALADSCEILEAAGSAADWETINRVAPEAKSQMAQVQTYVTALHAESSS